MSRVLVILLALLLVLGGVALVFFIWVGVRIAQHSRSPAQYLYKGKSPKQRWPIILVHGLNRSGRMWMVPDDGHGNPIPGAVSMADFLRKNGYPNIFVNTFQDTRNTSLFENARILKKWIDTAKTKYGASKVDLITHSMGGLIARAYMQEMDMDNGARTAPIHYDRDVGRLIMIAAPNLGSPLADPFASILNWYAPRTLRTGGGPDLRYLNARPLPCGVWYSSILLSTNPGDSRRGFSFWRVIRFVLAFARPLDGDGTVGLRSQRLENAVNINHCPSNPLSAHRVQAEPGIRHRDAPMSPAVQGTILRILNQ
jgi:pimeloyl-ACP methyl ester carboxylesterase